MPSAASAASTAAASRGPLAGSMQHPFFALMDREQPGDIPLLITMPRSAEPAAASLFERDAVGGSSSVGSGVAMSWFPW